MNKVLLPLITLSIFLISIQAFIKFTAVPEYIFPDFFKIISSLIENRQAIFSNSLITLSEAVLGFLIANLISVFIAFLISFKKHFENIIMPFAISLKTIPIVAIAPILILWFGPDMSSKVVIVTLICFFPSLVNVLRGIKSLDPDLIELFKTYSASKWQTTKMLIFPSILPYLFSALKVSSSLAVVGALVGEFIATNKGLGFLILVNYHSLNMPYVFATILVSSLMGIFFYYFIHFLEKRAITWSTSIE